LNGKNKIWYKKIKEIRIITTFYLSISKKYFLNIQNKNWRILTFLNEDLNSLLKRIIKEKICFFKLNSQNEIEFINNLKTKTYDYNCKDP